MTSRAPCIVPGCKNSSAKFAGREYLCSRHFPMVSKATRREHAADWRKHDRGEPVTWDAWERAKIEAIERAAGL